MKQLKPKLTYANVIGTLALFLALGAAGAFAATQLPKNSVGTKQLKKNAVTSAKVKNSSLLSADFKPGQLPAGAKGETGATGPRGSIGLKGDPGLSGYVQVDEFSAFNSTSPKNVQATCPAGMTVIGGGATVNGVAEIALRTSEPESGTATEANSWLVEAYETKETTAEWNVDDRVICAQVTP